MNSTGTGGFSRVIRNCKWNDLPIEFYLARKCTGA